MARGSLRFLAVSTAAAALLAGVFDRATGANQAPPRQASPGRLTIVLVGDAAFNGNDAKVDAKGIHEGKQVTSFADTLAGVAGAIDGDIGFADLDTVITDRNDLDDQLFDTFAASRQLLRQDPVQAESRAHLKTLLKVASGGVVFTTIQKFQPEIGRAHV